MYSDNTTPNQPISVLQLGGRELPHNNEAEIAVLGCLFIDPINAADVVITRLSPFAKKEGTQEKGYAFHNPAHQVIFEAFQKCINDGDSHPDSITVADVLERSERLEEAGGPVYLAQLMNSVPTAANVEQYVDIVRQNAILRRLITVGMGVVDKCFEPVGDVREVVDAIEKEMMEITNVDAAKGMETVRKLAKSAVQYIENLSNGQADALGLSTGYKSIDKLITGLHPAEMIVLAARPSIGKTALALNIATNIALGNYVPRKEVKEKPAPAKVGFFSLEMPAKMLVVRMLCSEARLGLRELREAEVLQNNLEGLLAANRRLKETKFVIDDTGGLNITELRIRARRMKRDHDIQALFIDYLQLLQIDAGKNSNRENEVAKMSGSIKALAKELNVPIVVLAQLNRQAEQSGQKPKLSHLRESGAIEQDADVVALLHRDRELQIDSDNAKTGVEAELIIAKNRNGETGVANLTFLPAYTKFEDRAHTSSEDIPPSDVNSE